jgi:hypothetical protein
MIEHNIEGVPERYHQALQNNEMNERAGFFIKLETPAEEQDYRQWAREHYKMEDDIKATWHPIIVNECLKIIKEFINGNSV